MQAWDAFLCSLEQKMGKEVIDKWLRPFKVLKFDAGNLYLEAQNTFQITWFEEHIRALAKKELVNNNSRPIKIHFYSIQKKNKKHEEEPPPTFQIQSDFVDPAMQFSNFYFENQTAITVELLKNLNLGAYNPIFLYGLPGTGKTHLLMAIANALLSQNLKIFYVHAETFTEHVVKAIRNSQMQSFREIYRNQDILLVDDVHHFARKMATQEELFHTFNSLHTSGKQIILTSSHLPSRIEDIEPRLISRFEWGIVFQIYPLLKEKMKEVLQNRARVHHFPLSEELAHFLIEEFSTSSKSMMRALEALMMRHRRNDSLTIEEAKTLLFDLLDFEKQLTLTPEKIFHATSAYFGIRQDDITGKSQSKECTFARKLAMFLCRKKLQLSYPAIGRLFTRDHSTVMGNIKQIEKKSSLKEIASALEEIELLLVKENI